MKTRRILAAFFVLFSMCSIAGNFTSTGVTSAWTSTTTWTLSSGTDADGIPDADDNVTINHSVTGSTNRGCKDLTIGASGIFTTGSYNFYIYGNFSNSGTVNISGTLWILSGAGTFSTTTALSPSATWGIKIVLTGTQTRTFSSGTVACAYMTISGSGTVVNNANITIGQTGTLASSITGVVFNNSTNGVLTIKRNVTYGTGGSLLASANPNTVTYTTVNATSIAGTTYHILSIDNGTGVTVGTKTLAGNITVNSALTLASNVQLNCANFDVTCNGTWTNNNPTNNLTNTGGTFTFGGTNPNILRKTNQEVLGNVVINCTGTMGCNSSNTATYTGNFTTQNLTLTSGALDLNSTGQYTVNVKGNLSGNGGSISTNGTVFMNGTTAQTIGGTTPLSFERLTISNAMGVSTTAAENLTGTLTVSSGTFTSNSADFTLVSNSTTGTTGRVAALTSGSIAGNRWVIQRRILTSGSSTSTPYWGDYSSPVTSATLSDWDNEMYLSGVGGADGNACCPIFYSVKEWNNGGGDYSNVTSLVNLTPGIGYTIWTASTTTSLTAFTFDTQGTPNSGAINKTCSAADYYLLGNPYPSQITWSSLSRTNIDDYFYILDESISDYATWDGSSSTGTGKLNGSGGVINSSQGFMVYSNGSGTLGFTESAKSSSSTSFVRMPAPQDLVKFHFSNGERQVGTENMICFQNGAASQKDALDIPFLRSPFPEKYEVKTLSSDGIQLCKNSLSASEEVQEVPLVFIPARAGDYSVSFEGLDLLQAYTCVYLENIATGEFTDLKASKSYFFKCATNDEYRFVIHFTRGSNYNSCFEKSNAFVTLAENAALANVYSTQSNIVLNFYNTQKEKVKVSIYNLMGQQISSFEQSFSEGNFLLEKPGVSGIYLVTLQKGGKAETHKILID